MFLAGVGPLPAFDELGRPAWMFTNNVHQGCVRGGFYEEGLFAEKYGDAQCLVELGCWGPVVQCNMVSRGAIGHAGGCMNTGGICIGCTMPGFPDRFSPFYKRPPGSLASTTAAYGGDVHPAAAPAHREFQNASTGGMRAANSQWLGQCGGTGCSRRACTTSTTRCGSAARRSRVRSWNRLAVPDGAGPNANADAWRSCLHHGRRAECPAGTS
jgi:hypothetical protein